MVKKAIVIGAGVAGLTAAYYLEKEGYSIDLIEKSDQIGGRIKTDVVEGFLLDHGFQVLLDAYPECKKILDYRTLALKRFASGAIILHENGSRSKVADPRRDFSSFLPTIMAKMGTVWDKIKLLRLATRLNYNSIENTFSQKEESTIKYLTQNFGNEIRQHFFYPFFRGIMLDKELNSSKRVFDFVFKMFGEGYATVPTKGMQAIPEMIAGHLNNTSIRFNTEVKTIVGKQVHTIDHQTLEADVIVIATEANGFVKSISPSINQKYVSNTTVYFSSEKDLGTDHFLVLNSKKNALVNHLVQMDKVANSYAPKGKHLIACSILGYHDNSSLIDEIKTELSTWFESDISDWKHLKTYTIRYALPDQSNAINNLTPENAMLNEHTFVGGDHMLNGSINAAMKSGRQVAELISTRK